MAEKTTTIEFVKFKLYCSDSALHSYSYTIARFAMHSLFSFLFFLLDAAEPEMLSFYSTHSPSLSKPGPYITYNENMTTETRSFLTFLLLFNSTDPYFPNL